MDFWHMYILKAPFIFSVPGRAFQRSPEAACLHLPGNRWTELGICLRMSLRIMFPICSFSLSTSAGRRVQNRHILLCLRLN